MNDLTVIEHNNQRVLTTQQLAEVYDTEPERIQQNYLRNQDRFTEGKHYFKLEGNELAEFKRLLSFSVEPSIKFAPSLILWTEREANRHSKLLGTDKAWEQFDVLEETYFKVKFGAVALPSTTLEVLQLAIGKMVEQEQEIKSLQDGQSKMERRLELVKETIVDRIQTEWIPAMKQEFASMIEATGKGYAEVYNEAYTLLERRAGCKLWQRVKNIKDRKYMSGATSTEVNKTSTLEAIDADARLREIFTSIVKELKIKYVA